MEINATIAVEIVLTVVGSAVRLNVVRNAVQNLMPKKPISRPVREEHERDSGNGTDGCL